ncbi:MAG: mechanosensitive ion channel [Dehalococcoidales bacterium]|nr:mechanosensitive ion channel [Dehalococcoidales bacterium]
MIRKIITQFILLAITAALWLAMLRYDNFYLRNSAHTFLAVSIIYLVFKFILEEAVTGRISDPRTRYSFRRAVSILNIVAFIVAGIAIWVENTQSLLVSYGLIAAGVAVALQDFFKNIVGGIILFIMGVYRVGDRIEINDKRGDVIDIGLQYTTLLEIQEWIIGDQPTGRLVTVPNGNILSHAAHNYSKDHHFIWDEISLPITYDSDWKGASRLVLNIVEKETQEVTERARISLLNLSEKYFLPARAEVPALYLTLTDNWIEMNVRYVTDVRQRRVIKDHLSKFLLEEIQKAGNIRIASETMDLTIRDTVQPDTGFINK